MIPAFHVSRTPALHFGTGMFDRLAAFIGAHGRHVLVITGALSFEKSGKKAALETALAADGIEYAIATVSGEPSPDLVDDLTARYRTAGIQVVCSIGGGSVVDAGKAVSAMLPCGGSVVDYLEGVGTGARHDGSKVPFIAVPTTAGTGSEATKNAVLSRTGPGGFKKSLRHDNFVPDNVVIDPALMLSCPRDVTAATGMDAFTQLLESYVSTKANPITDALALCGMEHAAANLVRACNDGADDPDVRGGMAIAAYLSGITLANAGLGVVHGLASAIGGFFPIPHGVVCGTLCGVATAVTIETLKRDLAAGEPALRKFARAGRILSGKPADCGENIPGDCNLLVERLDEWTDSLSLPRLGEYGVTVADFDTIIGGTGNKNNPVALGGEDVRRIIEKRL